MKNVQKAKTNWHFVIWPILILWIASAIYVFNSEFREEAEVTLPLLMAGTAFLVFVGNAVAGSAAQNRLDMEAAFGDATACMECRKSGCRLELVDYEYGIFLFVVVIQRRVRGKLCRECATRRLNMAFVAGVFGCILCPPLILFSWLKRRRILAKYDQPGPVADIRAFGNG